MIRKEHFILPIIILFFSILVFFSSKKVLLQTGNQFDNLENTENIFPDSNLIKKEYKNYKIEALAQKYLSELSINEKVGQMFILQLAEKNISNDTVSLVVDYNISGFVLLSSSIANKEQVKENVNILQSKSKVPLIFAVDQEGGVVNRIKWDESYFISAPHVGIVNREDFAYEVASKHALALKNLHLNMNLAPVLDIANVKGSVFSNRSFGSDKDKVKNLGVASINAYNDSNLITCVKHFPGIGRTKTDSHSKLPLILIDKETMFLNELVPFRAAIENDVDFIMVGHASYPLIDNNYPSAFSRKIISEILIGELGFRGVILTDDLNMQSVKNYKEKYKSTIKAGADMIMIISNKKEFENALNEIVDSVKNGEISEERINESVIKILRVKIKRLYNDL